MDPVPNLKRRRPRKARWSLTHIVTYVGAALLYAVLVASVFPFSMRIFFLFGAVMGLGGMLPLYTPALVLQYFAEQRFAKGGRDGGLPLAIKDTHILARAAFYALGWAGVAWPPGEEPVHPLIMVPLAFVAYAHATHFVEKTGLGTRALGIGSIAFGVLPIVFAGLSLAVPAAQAIAVLIENVTFPGARFALAGYGFAVAWTGRRLLRIPLDDQGRWAKAYSTGSSR